MFRDGPPKKRVYIRNKEDTELANDAFHLWMLIERHVRYTGSKRGRMILEK
uniref:Uncharacterized protein n=1 Tax=Candidatus Kentrum sp. TUN TaxID=2126343 RepID=A0A451AG24_9GAMM|nr:MAG: hypothetical protein BECKTUN1418D_GA0071000_13045 [Candidatus Kentron sp. TUN]